MARRRRMVLGAVTCAVIAIWGLTRAGNALAQAGGQIDAQIGAQIGDPAASPADPAADAPPSPLRVVIAGTAPFVVADASAGAAPPTGLSVAVWSALADALDLRFAFVRGESVQHALDLVARGEADVAVGPISITAERAERVAFTHPYFDASLAILAPTSRSLLDRIRPFLTRAFLTGLGALLTVLVLVGSLVWLVERRHNPEQFPATPVRGIGNGVWMALVTMTTVGYGDRVPVSNAGRAITGVWMILAMIIASSLTAFMATAFTLSQIAGPNIAEAEDLRGRPVGVVAGTTSTRFVAEHEARPVRFSDLPAAVQALERGTVDAVVFDRPMLRYALKQRPSLGFEISPASYEPQGYGFALRLGAPFRHDVEVAMLRLQESGKLAAIAEHWLGP